MAFFQNRKKTKPPVRDQYLWTHHAYIKMRQYHLVESRIKRIIRFPTRVEEGILEGAIACMQKAEGKNYSEIWAMYVLQNQNAKIKNQKSNTARKRIKVITAWRYPGRSPKRDPIPPDVIAEVRKALGSLL